MSNSVSCCLVFLESRFLVVLLEKLSVSYMKDSLQCLIQCLAVSCCLFLSHSEILPIQAKQLLFSRVVGQRQMNRGEGLRAIASQTLSFLNCRSCWQDSQHPVPCIITNNAVQKYSVFHHHRCLEIFFCNGTSDAVCGKVVV